MVSRKRLAKIPRVPLALGDKSLRTGRGTQHGELCTQPARTAPFTSVNKHKAVGLPGVLTRRTSFKLAEQQKSKRLMNKMSKNNVENKEFDKTIEKLTISKELHTPHTMETGLVEEIPDHQADNENDEIHLVGDDQNLHNDQIEEAMEQSQQNCGDGTCKAPYQTPFPLRQMKLNIEQFNGGDGKTDFPPWKYKFNLLRREYGWGEIESKLARPGFVSVWRDRRSLSSSMNHQALPQMKFLHI